MRRLFVILFIVVLAVACTATQSEPAAQNDLAQEAVESVAEAAVAPPADSSTELVEEVAEEAPQVVQKSEPAGAPFIQWNRTVSRHELQLVNLADGTLLDGYEPIALGTNSTYGVETTLSPDGRLLAALEAHGQSCTSFMGGSSCRPGADVLHLVDLANWQEVVLELPGEGGWVWPRGFSPDNSQIALAYNVDTASELILVDAASGAITAQKALDFQPTMLGFSGDGQTIVLFGADPGADPGTSPPGESHVQLLDLATLEVAWDQPLAGITNGYWCAENCDSDHVQQLIAQWTPAVVLAPGGQQLYIVHADADQLTTVDLMARTVKSVSIEVAQGWFERLLALTAGVAEAKSSMTGATKQAVISPDGTRLYVVGQTFDAEWDEQEGYWFQTTTPLNLQVLDVASGRVVDSLEQEVAEIKLTPDGNYLLLTQWGDRGPITNIVDASTLETINSLEFFDVYVTYQRDHQPAVVASRYTGANWNMAALDPQTFELGPSWSAGSIAAWIPIR